MVIEIHKTIISVVYIIPNMHKMKNKNHKFATSSGDPFRYVDILFSSISGVVFWVVQTKTENMTKFCKILSSDFQD